MINLIHLRFSSIEKSEFAPCYQTIKYEVSMYLKIFFICCFIISCSDDHLHKRTQTQSSADANFLLLNGDWTSDCYFDEGNIKDSYLINGNSLDYTSTSFSDEQCLNKEFSMQISSQWSNMNKIDNVQVFKIIAYDAEITVHSAFIRDNFNYYELYGYNDWRLNEPKNITNKKKGLGEENSFFKNGDIFYSAYKILNNDLCITDTSDSSEDISNFINNSEFICLNKK